MFDRSRHVGLAVEFLVGLGVELVEFAAVVVFAEDELCRRRRDDLLGCRERWTQGRVGHRLARSVDADGPDVIGRVGLQRLIEVVVVAPYRADRNDIFARREGRVDLTLDVIVEVFAQGFVVAAVFLIVLLGDDVPDVENALVRGLDGDIGAGCRNVGDLETEGVLGRIACRGRRELHLGELGRGAVLVLVVTEGRDIVFGVGLQAAEVHARGDRRLSRVGEEPRHRAAVEFQHLFDELFIAHCINGGCVAHVDEVGHRRVKRFDEDRGAVVGDLHDLEGEGLGLRRSLDQNGFAQRIVARETRGGVVAGNNEPVLRAGGELLREGELLRSGMQVGGCLFNAFEQFADGRVGEVAEGCSLEEVAVP